MASAGADKAVAAVHEVTDAAYVPEDACVETTEVPNSVEPAASTALARALVVVPRCAASATPSPTPAAAMWAAAAAAGDPSSAAFVELLERRKALKRERDQLTRDLRNADKRRVRLVEKARGLSDDDLVHILAARASAKAKAGARAKPKPRAKARCAACADGEAK